MQCMPIVSIMYGNEIRAGQIEQKNNYKCTCMSVFHDQIKKLICITIVRRFYILI